MKLKLFERSISFDATSSSPTSSSSSPLSAVDDTMMTPRRASVITSANGPNLSYQFNNNGNSHMYGFGSAARRRSSGANGQIERSPGSRFIAVNGHPLSL